MKLRDLSGQRFARLTVIARIGAARRPTWECRCDCGKTAIVMSCNLTTGHTRSCGCLVKETSATINRTHGMSHTRVFRVWSDMLKRCLNPRSTSWPWYGGRGIKVCKRWHRFENFLSDMGEPSSGYSIERKDGNGDYEPKNCVWIPRGEQQKNRTWRNAPKEICPYGHQISGPRGRRRCLTCHRQQEQRRRELARLAS